MVPRSRHRQRHARRGREGDDDGPGVGEQAVLTGPADHAPENNVAAQRAGVNPVGIDPVETDIATDRSGVNDPAAHVRDRYITRDAVSLGVSPKTV